MAALERGKHQILSHNLVQLREAIDKFHGDRGVFPDRLEDLVERRYLRAVPLNPFTEQADWVTVMPPGGQRGMVYDVKPSAATPARDDPGAPEGGALPASAGTPS
jgi:general secretion pathway protein G